ncbi:aminoacetone oxidase family FAD-binding enzyme [candidate division TA06 bacterium]|uniref:Aminoacetone oxidase family FAD-binding enzyme n=1 Tax=candidate division TA06 bacterium TaxID=2250710 RepID=A0A933I9V8_UNCT6|nr:aminoacetone oxidase family FAD-binding enzyme [candidate division TA06 bacterium]
MPKKEIHIIGGGASGMIAAIAAARGGAKVRLWEKSRSLGRKLLATGNGRCNFANRDLAPKHFHTPVPTVADMVLSQFELKQTLEFFEGLGIEYYCDARGRYFPKSNEAPSVLLALEREMGNLGIEVNLHSEIVDIKKTKTGFLLHQRGQSHQAQAVILTCGGAAAPQLGGGEGGYQLARQLGHNVTPLRPALASLELEGNWYHKLQGIRLDMGLTVFEGSKKILQLIDEGLFTKYGLSGPLALKSSRILGEGRKQCFLNFVPGQTSLEMLSVLVRRAKNISSRPAQEFFNGLLPQKIGQMLIRESKIDPGKDTAHLSETEIKKLASNITAWPAKVKAVRPFKEAQVTVGGVDLREVIPETLESKKIPGLYFAGEILDVDGDTGGYNLQWAWSSGQVAGKSAASG